MQPTFEALPSGASFQIRQLVLDDLHCARDQIKIIFSASWSFHPRHSDCNSHAAKHIKVLHARLMPICLDRRRRGVELLHQFVRLRVVKLATLLELPPLRERFAACVHQKFICLSASLLSADLKGLTCIRFHLTHCPLPACFAQSSGWVYDANSTASSPASETAA